MATEYARRWAYFIVDKLGLPYTKAEIIRFADFAEEQAVWDKFVASNKEFFEAAKANHIEGPEDVYRFFRDASYSGMRATFPSRSNGRTILGPRIVPLQRLREQRQESETEKGKYRVSLSELKELNDAIGKNIFHSAENGLVYGKGTVVGVNGEKGIIFVEFESGIKRTFRYRFCLDKGFIRFL